MASHHGQAPTKKAPMRHPGRSAADRDVLKTSERGAVQYQPLGSRSTSG